MFWKLVSCLSFYNPGEKSNAEEVEENQLYSESFVSIVDILWQFIFL